MVNNYFIAVMPNEKVKEKINEEFKKIKLPYKNLKIVDKKLYHITLKFFGKNKEEALKEFEKYNIRYQKFTAFKYDYFKFENSTIRVFYIAYLACNGNYHLTLFRAKKPFLKKEQIPFEKLNENYNFFESISFYADKIYLLKSEINNGKLEYKIIKEKNTL